MEKLNITCNPENIASRKTCKYVGGNLLEIVDVPENNNMYQRGEKKKFIYVWVCK
jgi:predicted acetyltransferase